MERILYTIGYAGSDMEDFLACLTQNKVRCLIDVRSSAASSQWPQYNQEVLKRALAGKGIKYRHYPEFGARQADRQYYDTDGILCFETYAQSERYLNAVQRILHGMELGWCFALMCAEKDALQCHRANLVARTFHEQGCKVFHLRVDGSEMESHAALERRLFRLFKEDPDQQSLLESDAERLNRLYRMQNKRIGFHIEELH